MSHRNAPSTEDTTFNSSRYCLSPNGVPVTGANHSSFCHKDSWHLEIMRRTAPPPAHSHTLLCYFHLCNSKKKQKKGLCYMDVFGVRRSNQVLLRSVELNWHELLCTKLQSWHVNSQRRLRAEQPNFLMRSFGWSTNTPSCALLPDTSPVGCLSHKYNWNKTQFLNLLLLQNMVILLTTPKHVHMLQWFQIEVK